MNSRSHLAFREYELTTQCSRTGTATGHHPLERDDSSSVGELHVNYEGRVTDPEDETRVLGRNEVGDIWLRGPSTSSGYWKNEDATRQLRGPDNWIRTGDIGYVDDNGKWYIVDRKKVSYFPHVDSVADLLGSHANARSPGSHEGQRKPCFACGA